MVHSRTHLCREKYCIQSISDVTLDSVLFPHLPCQINKSQQGLIFNSHSVPQVLPWPKYINTTLHMTNNRPHPTSKVSVCYMYVVAKLQSVVLSATTFSKCRTYFTFPSNDKL